MTESESKKVCLKVKENFQIDIDLLFKDVEYEAESLHEIKDLVYETRYFIFGIANMDLRFQDRIGLLEALIKFTDKQISNIPNELEALEHERSNARYWDEVQHFHVTEGLSEKEGKLNKLKSKLQKELRKQVKIKR